MANTASRKSSSIRRNSAKSTKKSSSRATRPRLANADGGAAKEREAGHEEVPVDRRRKERRGAMSERGDAASPNAPQLERREKVNRRRQIDPTTCERDYTEAEIEFMNALDDYKRKSGRMFPTCSEVLEVFRGLGYVKLSQSELGAVSVEHGPTTSAKPMQNAL